MVSWYHDLIFIQKKGTNNMYNINDIVKTNFRVGKNLINLVRVETGWEVTNRSHKIIYGVISERNNYCFFGWKHGGEFARAINKAIRFSSQPFRYFVEQNTIIEIPEESIERY
jgi:hypothetical protein